MGGILMEDAKYLTPRDLFDPAIINEGYHTVYSYELLLDILVKDYVTQILDTSPFNSVSLKTVEVEATFRAKQWLRYLMEDAFYRTYRGPLIAHTCKMCLTPINGEIGLCPATEYKQRCKINACTF